MFVGFNFLVPNEFVWIRTNFFHFIAFVSEDPMGNSIDKWIIHLDLDSFYAAVEVLDNPGLKGKPVIVGGLGRRGVVSTASYEARAMGVRSGLPMSRARQSCPGGIFVSPRIDRYKELSAKVMAIFRRYTDLVEPLSLDEAYLDVTETASLHGGAVEIAKKIKNEVRLETGLTISAGVSTQKQLSKIASGMNKPDALTAVPAGNELEFLWPLDLKELWGVGGVTLEKLHSEGLKTIGDLAKLSERRMIEILGKRGGELWLLANGTDKREVIPEREVKSVGAEITFDYDISGEDKVARALSALSAKVAGRLEKASIRGHTLTLKMRDQSFKTNTRSKTLETPFGNAKDIFFWARKLLPGGTLGPFRLLGLQVSKLTDETRDPPMPTPLFDDEPDEFAEDRDFRITMITDEFPD
jgi:DNA polymerase-4